MVDEGRTGVSRARDDVHDASWQFRLLQNLRKEERGQRGGLRWLQHDGVARGERWRDLPGQHEQREIPGNDLRGNTERARRWAEAGVVELVRPSCVIEEPGSDQRNVDIAALLDRLAVVQALRDSEFACALLHEPGDAKQVLSTIRSAHPRPDFVVGLTRCGNGQIDILCVRSGNVRDVRLVSRRDRGKRGAATIGEFAVDEQAIALLQVQNALRLWGRSVFEKAHDGIS